MFAGSCDRLKDIGGEAVCLTPRTPEVGLRLAGGPDRMMASPAGQHGMRRQSHPLVSFLYVNTRIETQLQ